jgi:hypothetical protein
LPIVALGLLVMCGAGIFSGQLYLNRPAMTEKIRAVFSKKFGGELTFQRIRLNILSGLTVQDLRLAAPDAGDSPFLTLRRADVRYSPLALLRKKIKVTRVDLQQARLNFAHQGDRWVLPQPQANFIKQALTLSTGHNTFVIMLDDLNLHDATVSVHSSAASQLLFTASGIDLSGQLLVRDNQGVAQGALSVRELKIGETLTLGEVRADLAYADDELTFTKLRGQAYGGAAEGTIVIPTSREKDNPHYGVWLHFSGVDFPALIKSFNADPELIHAKVDVYCDLWGDIHHPGLLQGKGWFESRQARLTGFKVLDIIGNLLNRPDLRDTRFDTVSGSFKITNDQLSFYSLEIISPDLKISAAGNIKYDGTIDFDVLLTVNPALTAQLPKTVAEQFSTQPDGNQSIAFKTSGFPDSPICNLADKLYGKPPEAP